MPLKEKRGLKENESRARVANWQHGETILLLEEIRLERRILLSAHCAEVTHKKKEQVWTKVAEKVTTAFGVAPRTAFKCREKWGSLKAAAIKQSRHGVETGGGPPKQFLPSDIFDLVMAIVGEKSTVLNGIQVEGTQTFLNQEKELQPTAISSTDSSDGEQVADEKHRGIEANTGNVFTFAVPSNQGVIHVDVVDIDASDSQAVREEVPSTSSMDTGPHIIDAEEGPTTPIKIKRLAQRKFTKNVTRKLPYNRPQQHQSSSRCTSTPRVSRNGSFAAESDSHHFNQYLQSEINKNECLINLYRKKSKKVSLEIVLLKQAIEEQVGAWAHENLSDEEDPLP